MSNDILSRRLSSFTQAKKKPDTPSAPPEGADAAPHRPSVTPPPLAPRTPAAPPAASLDLPSEARAFQNEKPFEPAKETVAPPAPVASMSTSPSPSPEPAGAAGQPAPLNDQAVAANPEVETAHSPKPAAPPAGEKLMSFIPVKDEEKAEAPRPTRDANQPKNRSMGQVISCSGAQAMIVADTECFDTVTGQQWAVGRLLSISVGTNRVVALIYQIDSPREDWRPEDKNVLMVHVELQGEVQDDGEGNQKFVKGITAYPPIGSTAHQIRSSDLATIYASTGQATAVVGSLSQDATIPAFVDIEEMISKHFAVLGSTGCGKSSSVSLLLHASQELLPDLRVLIMDPHNEYSCAFPDAHTINSDTLDLPFWLFQLEEYAEVLFRGKPIVAEEVDVLREMIPMAKIRFREGEDRVTLRVDTTSNAITADTPLPYRMSDLLAILDEEIGQLDTAMDKGVLKNLKARIEAHCNDPRYKFMFTSKTITDRAAEVIGTIFRMPANGSYSTILQMGGMPSEVVNAVASVLCRMAFELCIAAHGGMKILVVCEEAHRYVPADTSTGFGPTRRALARIAKEGRKYGCFMAIISQRPAELDSTILSQCSTVFSLRLSNEYDQEIIRKAISSSSSSAVTFLSSIGNREAIAFGEGLNTPMRMKFANLPVQWLPGQESDVFGRMGGEQKEVELNTVLRSWRRAAGG